MIIVDHKKWDEYFKKDSSYNVTIMIAEAGLICKCGNAFKFKLTEGFAMQQGKGKCPNCGQIFDYYVNVRTD